MLMKNIILEKVNNRLRAIVLKGGGAISYSQSGEDLILNCIFMSKEKGFYIDVGANHPTKDSNTYFFYKKGWTGINIDALPEAMNLFRKQRKYDINIEAGISDIEDILNFYIFKESSYNTFNEKIIDEIKKVTQLEDVKKISVKPLCSILSQLNISSIDFMSVDVEGLDLNILRSNDWNNFRPKVVLVEDLSFGIDISNNSIYEYLHTLGYVYFCKTVTNAFYIEQDFYNERFIRKNK